MPFSTNEGKKHVSAMLRSPAAQSPGYAASLFSTDKLFLQQCEECMQKHVRKKKST